MRSENRQLRRRAMNMEIELSRALKGPGTVDGAAENKTLDILHHALITTAEHNPDASILQQREAELQNKIAELEEKLRVSERCSDTLGVLNEQGHRK